jgi:hypothetical protein
VPYICNRMYVLFTYAKADLTSPVVERSLDHPCNQITPCNHNNKDLASAPRGNG